jgi:hypothetical protein
MVRRVRSPEWDPWTLLPFWDGRVGAGMGRAKITFRKVHNALKRKGPRGQGAEGQRERLPQQKASWMNAARGGSSTATA